MEPLKIFMRNTLKIISHRIHANAMKWMAEKSFGIERMEKEL